MHTLQAVTTKDNHTIQALFHDGKVVTYDLKPLFAVFPAFRVLQSDEALYQNAKISKKGDMIFWTDNLNLDADTIWENGTLIEVRRPTDIKHLLAYRLRLAREQVGMTQKELAEKTGIYQADISKFERGLGNPSLDTLSRLAEGLEKELFIEFREITKNNTEEDTRMVKESDTPDIYRHKTLEERAAEYGGQLNLAGEYDWGEPVGREVW